jgi:hypothetical protein
MMKYFLFLSYLVLLAPCFSEEQKVDLKLIATKKDNKNWRGWKKGDYICFEKRASYNKQFPLTLYYVKVEDYEDNYLRVKTYYSFFWENENSIESYKAEEELKKAFKDEKGRTQTFFSDITIQNASEWTGDAYPPRPSIFGFLKRE